MWSLSAPRRPNVPGLRFIMQGEKETKTVYSKKQVPRRASRGENFKKAEKISFRTRFFCTRPPGSAFSVMLEAAVSRVPFAPMCGKGDRAEPCLSREKKRENAAGRGKETFPRR